MLGLTFRPGPPWALVGPAAAVVAGALSSGELAAEVEPFVKLALAVLLADPLLGGLWSAVTASGWRQRWQAAERQPAGARHLPHTVPGSPAHRLAEAIARLGASADAGGEGGVDVAGGRVAFFLAASLAVAAALGSEVVLLVAAAGALSWLQALLGAYNARLRWPESAFSFATCWLIGFAALGGLPMRAEAVPLAVMAAAWTVAVHGFRGVAAGDSPSSSLAALDGGQLAALALLVVAGRPWQAGIAAVLLAAQALGQPRYWRDGSGAAYVAVAYPYVVAAMLVTFV